MNEAILLVETGWSPDDLANASERVISNFITYKAIKHISQNGGTIF
jgi:hypothetical protein